MIKFVEIFEYSAGYDEKIKKCRTIFSLRELYVNPDYIISMRFDDAMHAKSKSNEFIDGLDKNASFTELTVCSTRQNSKVFSVVGRPDSFLSKIGKLK